MMKKRPLSVTIAGYVLVAAGFMGVIYHSSDWMLRPFQFEIVWISLVRLLAIVAGVAMLRGYNWGRWLSLVWIAFHVVVSYWHGWPEVAMHAALLVVFAYILFRPAANQYFAPSENTAGALF